MHLTGNTFNNENKLNSTRMTNVRTNLNSIGDKVPVTARKNSKHNLEHDGPCEITQVDDDDTVHFQKGTVIKVANTRQIKPFHEQTKICKC
jgi:hypothetical protein